ncbi:MAG: hypothetical protein E7218_05540 [Anaerofustis stercorihominis]|nr:hypothetical protein [Anaerofustis stercorihominis]
MKYTDTVKKNRIITASLAVVLVMLMLFNLGFAQSYYSMSDVQFQNLDDQMLSASYSQSSNGKGVIIASDLSHDKGELSNLVYELKKLGYGIYVFDYPSNGYSGGNVPFGIRENDYLAEQFYCALVSFSQLSGILQENIHIVGYGMGARGILNCASLGLISPASLTVVGADINLTNRLQYDILNFTVDTELEWIKNLSAQTPGCDINIIYAPFDNISTKDDADALKEILSAGGSVSSRKNNVSVDSAGSIHILTMYSASVARAVTEFISGLDSISYTPQFMLSLRGISIAIMFGLYIALLRFINGCLPVKKYNEGNVKITKSFFRDKIVMLLAGVATMAVIAFVLYLIPIRYPYNDMFALCLFSGYGVAMLFLYRYSSFGGGIGKYMFTRDRKGKYRFISLVMFAITLGVGLIALCSFYNPFSIFLKFDWAIIFTLLCATTFYIDERERHILNVTYREKLYLILINYAPIIIGFVAMIIIGQFSYAYKMLTMMVMIVLAIASESLTRRIGSSSRMSALFKGFVFSMIIFSQATMFFNL